MKDEPGNVFISDPMTREQIEGKDCKGGLTTEVERTTGHEWTVDTKPINQFDENEKPIASEDSFQVSIVPNTGLLCL